MPAGKVVSLSVDLDPVECYFRIHALPGPPPELARHLILRRCLPRFAELFARHGVKATFFVVGRDLEEDQEGRRLLAELGAAGHELANHSYAHLYEFTRLPRPRIAEEIDRAHQALADCAGAPPAGFRAPGYETSATVMELLAERGYRYDSSTFPSVPYYLAKAVVMGLYRLRGRASGSILARPAVLRAPRLPYQPSLEDVYRPARPGPPAGPSGGDAAPPGPIQLPISVTPTLRLPVIGTSLITAPEWLRRHLVAAALRQPFFNLELHGIDLADADADGFPPALVARQPDLRRSLRQKLAALDRTLIEAKAAGAQPLTLSEFTRRLSGAHPG